MRTTKHFLAFLLCLLLCVPAVPAQDKQAANNPISQDVTIIIGQQQVRFTAQKAVQEMQLQIFNQAGELTFDSGVLVAQPEINWPLQQANGEALKSGLYAYTLSIKEAGAETARVRRGHFIVDRAGDREANADRLWITSQGNSGVGTELTVARSEENTVAGAVITSERTVGEGHDATRREGERTVEAQGNKTNDQVALRAPATAITSGTVGKLAKFTSTTDLGDSVIAESNGNVGIGTTALLSKLTVRTPTSSYGLTHTDGDIIIGTWTGNSSGWFGTWSNHPLHFFTANSSAKMTLDTAGNLGIGTTSPNRQLTVQSASGAYLNLKAGNGAQEVLLGADGNGGIVSMMTNHDLQLRAGGNSTKLLIKADGNVGVGTTNLGPEARLRVEAGASNSVGIWTNSNNSTGLFGSSSSATFGDAGVSGRSDNANTFGVRGWSVNGTGMWGHSDNSTGIYGHTDSNSAAGVYGRNEGSGYGVHGYTVSGYAGVWGLGGQNGVYGQTYSTNDAFSGVYGRNEGTGWGVAGSSANGHGVLGETANANKVGGYFRNTAGGIALKAEGTAQVGVLQITGGADFAENFEVNLAPLSSAATMKVEAGLVVAIDPANPGKLQLSTQAYDRRVAGIVSGAGGVKPGMMMSQAGTLAHGQYPVALTGRVYCWADASPGAIEPGDLLTTATTPGHAMKVSDPAKAQGAIIGKAMTGLKEGKGLVLVLVTLQ